MGSLKIVFFYRKKRTFENFSIEKVFDLIQSHLPSQIQPIRYSVSHESSGFWKRLFITWEAFRNQGDVNHVTGDINFITFFLKKRKTVLTIHDVGFMDHPNRIYRWLLKWFWIILPVWRSQIITVVSEATKQELLKYVRCKPAKIKVIHNPIDSSFKPLPNSFNKTKPTILQLGTAPNKNIERLLEALKGIPCHLEIVGKLTPSLKTKLRENNISYTNSWELSNEEIREKYKTCDIVTLISTYEGFGIPIIEANLAGKPVITSNILSMPEVAGNAAHLVNPYDIEDMRKGIVKVIEDDTYRERLIANGFENVKRFEVDNIVKEYCEVYESLLNA